MSLTAATLKRKYLTAKGLGLATRIELTQIEVATLLKALESFEKLQVTLESRFADQAQRGRTQLGVDLQRIASDVLKLASLVPSASTPAVIAAALTCQLQQLALTQALPPTPALEELSAYIQRCAALPLEAAHTRGNRPSCSPTADIEVLNSTLTVRCKNVLLGAGLRTLEDVLQMSKDQLLRLPNMGRTSLLHLSSWVTSHGHYLAES